MKAIPHLLYCAVTISIVVNARGPQTEASPQTYANQEHKTHPHSFRCLLRRIRESFHRKATITRHTRDHTAEAHESRISLSASESEKMNTSIERFRLFEKIECYSESATSNKIQESSKTQYKADMERNDQLMREEAKAPFRCNSPVDLFLYYLLKLEQNIVKWRIMHYRNQKDDSVRHPVPKSQKRNPISYVVLFAEIPGVYQAMPNVDTGIQREHLG